MSARKTRAGAVCVWVWLWIELCPCSRLKFCWSHYRLDSGSMVTLMEGRASFLSLACVSIGKGREVGGARAREDKRNSRELGSFRLRFEQARKRGHVTRHNTWRKSNRIASNRNWVKFLATRLGSRARIVWLSTRIWCRLFGRFEIYYCRHGRLLRLELALLGVSAHARLWPRHNISKLGGRVQ